MDTDSPHPSILHHKVYLHLSLTALPPKYYLLDFRPGTVDFEVANPESLSSTTSTTPWGRVYALPQSSSRSSYWNTFTTNSRSELDILVLMRVLEVINEGTPADVGWEIVGQSHGEGGVGFKIMLKRVLKYVDSTVPRMPKGGLVRYLLVVPEREEYTLWRDHHDEGAIPDSG